MPVFDDSLIKAFKRAVNCSVLWRSLEQTRLLSTFNLLCIQSNDHNDSLYSVNQITPKYILCE